MVVRAGHLTFLSVTTIVPTLAVCLSLLNALRGRLMEQTLREFVRDMLAPGVHDKLEPVLDSLLRHTASRTGSSISVVLLLLSAGTLVRNLDEALNDVWAVRRKRPVWLGGLLYFGLAVFGPLLLSASLAGIQAFRSALLAFLPASSAAMSAGPLLLAVLSLTVLYRLAPRATVTWRAALGGGLAGGLAWEVARHSYAGIAQAAYGANTVYGSLSIVPLFLVWVYVSWFLVLFGGRLAYALEHSTGDDMWLYGASGEERLGMRIVGLIARAAIRGDSAPSTHDLADDAAAPLPRVDELCDKLRSAGLVHSVRGGLRPTRDCEALTAAEVARALGRSPSMTSHQENAAERLLSTLDRDALERLGSLTWKDLAASTSAPLA